VKIKFKELEVVKLPDGGMILSIWILNGNGARIGKACGDLCNERREDIFRRACEKAADLLLGEAKR